MDMEANRDGFFAKALVKEGTTEIAIGQVSDKPYIPTMHVHLIHTIRKYVLSWIVRMTLQLLTVMRLNQFKQRSVFCDME